MLFRSRLRGMLATVAALGVVAIGIGMLAHRPAGARPQDAPAVPPRAKERRTAELVVRAADMSRRPRGRARSWASRPSTRRPASGGRSTRGGRSARGRVSPDGRSLVYSSLGANLPPALTGIWVYDMTGQRTLPRRIFDRRGEPFWINDGRQVVIGTWTDPGSVRYETWRVNADGSGRDPAADPRGRPRARRLARRHLARHPHHGRRPEATGRLTLVHPDGTGARHLTEGSAKDDRFSIFKIAPDGRSVAYAEITTVDKVRHAELFIVDIEGRNRRRIPSHFEPGTTVTVHWSPDGSRLALNLIDGETKEGSIVLGGPGRPEFPHPQDSPAARAMEPPGLRLDDARIRAPTGRRSPPTRATLRGRYRHSGVGSR